MKRSNFAQARAAEEIAARKETRMRHELDVVTATNARLKEQLGQKQALIQRLNVTIQRLQRELVRCLP
jgi:hypothetical protein